MNNDTVIQNKIVDCVLAFQEKTENFMRTPTHVILGMAQFLEGGSVSPTAPDLGNSYGLSFNYPYNMWVHYWSFGGKRGGRRAKLKYIMYLYSIEFSI